jgi:flap endonuclease GEN
MLPMQSTIYLRKIADNPSIEQPLLCKQYEFDTIQRVKIERGHPYYLVKWRRAISSNKFVERSSEESIIVEQTDPIEINDPDDDLFDKPVLPELIGDDKSWYVLTDENLELVQAAFPKAVERFHEKQVQKPSTICL